MPPLVIAATEPLSGKTTVAVALAQRVAEAGRTVALRRLGGDEHAASDAALFAGLPFSARKRPEPVNLEAVASDAGVTLVEAPAGDARHFVGSLSAGAVVVAAYADPVAADLPSVCAALGDACAGLIVTRVPRRRLEAARAAFVAVGVRVIGLIVEDRTLAAPTLEAVAEALEAEASFLDGARQTVIDRPVISSISADPAQGYVSRYNATAVIVRGDKPDQQMGALNAGAPCLIVTGGTPLLSYVEDRAREERIPVLRTRYDTVAAAERLESLCAATPFSGPAKVERIAQLTGDLDVSLLA